MEMKEREALDKNGGRKTELRNFKMSGRFCFFLTVHKNMKRNSMKFILKFIKVHGN